MVLWLCIKINLHRIENLWSYTRNFCLDPTIQFFMSIRCVPLLSWPLGLYNLIYLYLLILKILEWSHLLYSLNTAFSFIIHVSEVHWILQSLCNNNWPHNQWQILLNEQTNPSTDRTCSWSVSPHSPCPVIYDVQRG